MHQLYLMWGYDASADDALCQNAVKVNLMCKQGNASPDALAGEGYPWVSELKTGNHLNYAVVARVGETSMDLLMNNRTWQVSRNWFNQHATGNYTQLHRLTHRAFQQKMHLHVDGIPGEETLMQLMRETNTTPSVLIQASHAIPDAKMQEKHS